MLPSWNRVATWFVLICISPCAFGQSTQPDGGRQASGILPVLQQMGARDRVSRYAAQVKAWKHVKREDRELLEQAALGRHGERTRLPALILLGRLRDRASIPVLEATLGEAQERHVRQEAARVLGLIADPRGRPVLMKALTADPDPSVRKFAAIALGCLGDAESLRALRAAREDEQDSDVRAVIRETQDRLHIPRNRPAPLQKGQVSEGFLEGTRYLLYVPNSAPTDQPAPLLVSVHGTHGKPEGYIRMCLQDAERYGLVVLAPHFDYATFPEFGSLSPWISWERSDLRLLAIVDHVAGQIAVRSERLYLFGHSQGGQFVQRFLLAHPQRIERAAASASGQYVRSDSQNPFPWGTGRNPLMPDVGSPSFSRFVATPLAIVIGTNDAARRIKKAGRFVEDVRAYAKKCYSPCRVELIVNQGAEHHGRDNYPAAAAFLFRGLNQRETGLHARPKSRSARFTE